MKLRKEIIVMAILLVAFIAFFINAVIVVGDKNAKIQKLKEKNEALRKLYCALERDHTDLRKEKTRTINELKERLLQQAQETRKEVSPDNK